MNLANRRVAAAVLGCTLLVACGSTSKLSHDGDAPSHDFRRYGRVVVGEFGSRPAHEIPAAERAVYDAEVTAAGQRFTRLVVAALRRYGVRADTHGDDAGAALRIDGDITRYKDGNAALRLLFGFGAGSSYFDATVRFTGTDGERLGTIAVDKNSWPVGALISPISGLAAAAQDADAHMEGAAEKIAEQVAIAQGLELPGARERASKRVAKPAVGCGRGGCKETSP